MDLGIKEKNMNRTFSSIEIRGMPNKPNVEPLFSFSRMSVGKARAATGGKSIFSGPSFKMPGFMGIGNIGTQSRSEKKEQKKQDTANQKMLQALAGMPKKKKLKKMGLF